LPPLDKEREAVERGLAEICDTYLSSLPAGIGEAIKYALSGSGKKLRPLLVIAAYRACGGDRDVITLACATEVLHAYSLVHDDLPCMDDDDFRRGRPTVHRVYGSRTAIVAGVAMIPLAVQLVSEAARSMRLSPKVRSTIIETILEAVGIAGMIGGQARDLWGERLSLTLAQREEIHRAKTGALIAASLAIGAQSAGADDQSLAAVRRYGAAIGLAFQIMDDVLDVTSTTSALGKTAGRDEQLGKSTYPALLGVDGARKRARGLVDQGLESLNERGLLTQDLSQVANFILTRTS
jgi:geranylgeranyl diphosphate synthase type II